MDKQHKTLKQIRSGVPTRWRGHRRTGQPERLASGYWKQAFNSLAAPIWSRVQLRMRAVQHLCHSRCKTQQVSAYGRRDSLEIDVHIDVPFASFTLYLRAHNVISYSNIRQGR